MTGTTTSIVICGLVLARPHLEPDGIDDLAEHKQGEHPEGAEDGGEDKL